MTMFPRLTVAKNSCKSIPMIISRFKGHKHFQKLKKDNNFNLHDSILLEITNVINQSYEIGNNDFVDINYSSTIFRDKFPNTPENSSNYIWKINPIYEYDNFINNQNSYYTIIDIVKCGLPEASLIYNIPENVFITTSRGNGAQEENIVLRVPDENKLIQNFSSNDLNILQNLGQKTDIENVDNYSFISNIISLIKGEIDFIVHNNEDEKILDGIKLLCQESKLLMSKYQMKNNSKLLDVISRPKIHEKVISMID